MALEEEYIRVIGDFYWLSFVSMVADVLALELWDQCSHVESPDQRDDLLGASGSAVS